MRNSSFIILLIFLLFTFSDKAQNNIDFENGNLSGWTVTGAKNILSIPNQTCCSSWTVPTVVNGFSDPNLGFGIMSPLGGNWVVRLNPMTKSGQEITTITNTIAVTASNNYLRIAGRYALEKSGHMCDAQPFASIKVTDAANTFTILNKLIQANETSTVACSGSNFNAQTSGTVFPTNLVYYYNNAWDLYCIDLSPYIGNTIKIELCASECSYGDHGGYAYFDIKNPAFIPSGNSFTINSNSYSLTSTSLNIKECGTNTAIATAPLAASGNTWYGTGINGSNASSVQINQAGTYTLVTNLTNNSGCNTWNNSSTIYFTVGIIPPLSVSIPTSICNGSGVTFTLGGASHYYLVGANNGGTVHTTSSMPSLYIAGNPTTSISTNYSITGYSSLGCSPTTTINVISIPQPSYTVTGNNLCVGVPSTITVAGADTYTWVLGTTTLGITSNSISVPTPSFASLTIYGKNLASGCSSSTFVSAYPHSNTLTVSPSLPSVCIGKTISITSNGSGPAGTYTWEPGTNVVVNTIALSPTVTTTYTVSSQNNCGSASTAITVTVIPLPTVSISGPSTICPNAGYTYTGSGSSSNYTFAGLGSYSGPSNTIYVGASPSVTSAVMSVTVVSPGGCTNSSSMNISVLAAPVSSITTSSVPNFLSCQGGTIALFAPLGAASYSWNTGSTTFSTVLTTTASTPYNVTITAVNGCTVSTGNWVTVLTAAPSLSMVNSSYTVCQGSGINFGSLPCCANSYSVNNVSFSYYVGTYTPSASGIYTISAENPCGIVSTTFNVLVNPIPTISISLPSTLTICQYAPFTFTFTGGADKYSYWLPAYTNYTTGTSINTNSCTGSGFYSYYGTYTTTGCSTPNYTGYINSTPAPTINININPKSFCTGATVTLLAGGPPTSYTWSTGPISNTISYLVSSNTVISVTGTGTNGCIGTGVKTLTTIMLPTVSFTPINPTVCLGSNVNILASGINTFTWNTSANSSNIWVTPTVSTVYTVTGHNTSTNNPCPATGTVLVNVLPQPTVGFTAPLYTICAGQTAIITATGANSYYYPAYNYSNSILNLPNQNFNQIINVIGTGTGTNTCQKTATVQLLVFANPVLTIATTPTGGCQGTTFSISANGANTYSWNTSAITQSIVVSPTVSTNYSVIGTSTAGCTGTISQIAVVYGPNVTITSSTNNICVGSSATLSAGGASSYTWSTSSNNPLITVTPSVSTTYTVAGNNGQCTHTNVITVSVSPVPTISISGSTLLCYGASDILTANGASSYTWVSGPLTNTYFVTPTISSTYTVIGSGPNGCSSSANHNVTVYSYTNVTISAPNSLCIGQSATLIALGANTYSWVSGPQTDTYVVTPSVNTIYTVNATTSNGCLGTAIKSINVFNYPTITVNTNTNNVCSGSPVILTANGASSYTWSNNTFNSSTQVNPPASTNIYSVIGTNVTGCTSTQTIQINTIASPTVSLSSNNPIMCVGDLATVTAVGATSYSWSNFSFNYFIVTSPSVNTTYTVYGFDPNGCSDMAIITQSVIPCTGIQNNSADASVLIYPNPTHDIIYIELGNVLNNSSVEVYSSLGQLILTKEIENKSTAINLSKYANGIYYIKLKQGTKEDNFRVIKE